MRAAFPAAVLVSIGCSPVLLGCERLIGAEFDDARERIPTEAGSTCDPKHPPPPPTVENAEGEVEIVAVISEIDYGDGLRPDGTRDPGDIGFDLDGVCTEDADTAPCHPPEWTGAVALDGPNGQDTGVGRMLVTQEELFGSHVVSSELANDRVRLGLDAPLGLIRLRSYTGLADDDSVEVDFYAAMPPKPSDTEGFVPAFDGSDVWPVRSDYVEPGSGGAGEPPLAVMRDASAYVTKHRLVAEFGAGVVPLANIFFSSNRIILTAELLRDPTTREWSIRDGELAAIATADAILSFVPNAAYFTAGVTICTNEANYATIKEFVCQASDILLEGSSAETCDGMSVGVRFETAPAQIGPLTDPPAEVQLCEPEVDPARDTCETPP